MLEVKVCYSNGQVLYANLANPSIWEAIDLISDTADREIPVTEVIILGWRP